MKHRFGPCRTGWLRAMARRALRSEPMETDEALMKRLAEGDGAALDRLIDRWRARLFSFLLRRNAGDRAEDLFQETWLRVVRSHASFDRRQRFATWFFGIANNLCRDEARRRAVRARSTAAFASDSAETPLDLRLDARRRLAALPDRLREVLVLRYFEDLGEREIADVVGIPAGTVKSRLHAAVRALRGKAPDDVD